MAVGENTLKQIIAVEEAKLEVLKAQLEIIKAGCEDACETEKKPAKAKTVKKEEVKTADVDTSVFEEMTVKDLIALADANEVSVARAGKNKKYYIDKLVKAGVTPDAMNEPEADEEEVNEYAGKTAKELFTLCKERGIECKPKQKADVYITLLEADDKATNDDDDWGEDEVETDDDDWGEDEEEPVKKTSAKKSNKGGKKTSTKKTAKVEVEEDDDDDWDI